MAAKEVRTSGNQKIIENEMSVYRYVQVQKLCIVMPVFCIRL